MLTVPHSVFLSLMVAFLGVWTINFLHWWKCTGSKLVYLPSSGALRVINYVWMGLGIAGTILFAVERISMEACLTALFSWVLAGHIYSIWWRQFGSEKGKNAAAAY